MAVKTKYHLKAKVKDAYLELILAFPLMSIQSEEHLQAAQEVMDRLLAQGDLDSSGISSKGTCGELRRLRNKLLARQGHDGIFGT